MAISFLIDHACGPHDAPSYAHSFTFSIRATQPQQAPGIGNGRHLLVLQGTIQR